MDKNQEWDDRILIECQSTINIFKNKKYLTDIQIAGKPCRIQCNADTVQMTMKGMFENILVWYHPDGVANTLSLKTFKKYHVMYDSNIDGDAFKVETPGGVVKFKPCKNGLHYLDVNNKL